jgi:hypothetical protein
MGAIRFSLGRTTTPQLIPRISSKNDLVPESENIAETITVVSALFTRSSAAPLVSAKFQVISRGSVSLPDRIGGKS